MWEYHDPYHPASDELYHFKYIKRVQGPNGKWRYVYDQGSLRNDYRAAVNKVKQTGARAARVASGAYQNARTNGVRSAVRGLKSAIAYRRANRGLGSRQADRDAVDSMVARDRLNRANNIGPRRTFFNKDAQEYRKQLRNSRRKR